jgi:hypothetical protein
MRTATVQHLECGQYSSRVGHGIAEHDARCSSLAIFQVPQIYELNRRGDSACRRTLVEFERFGDLAQSERLVSLFDPPRPKAVRQDRATRFIRPSNRRRCNWRGTREAETPGR